MLPKILTQRNSRYKCHTVEEVVEMGVDCLELTQMAHLIHLSHLHQAYKAAMQMLPFIFSTPLKLVVFRVIHNCRWTRVSI